MSGKNNSFEKEIAAFPCYARINLPSILYFYKTYLSIYIIIKLSYKLCKRSLVLIYNYTTKCRNVCVVKSLFHTFIWYVWHLMLCLTVVVVVVSVGVVSDDCCCCDREDLGEPQLTTARWWTEWAPWRRKTKIWKRVGHQLNQWQYHASSQLKLGEKDRKKERRSRSCYLKIIQ